MIIKNIYNSFILLSIFFCLSADALFVELIHELTALSQFNQNNREALYKILFNDQATDENPNTGGFLPQLLNSPEQKKQAMYQRFTFADLAGEIPEDVIEVVDFIASPDKFSRVGAYMPKGVLLHGPPGTGKTSIARAIAGEANATFFHASASEFVEVYVGVGPQRVRELFNKARTCKKALIFIDEIDAIGGKRTGEPNSEYRNTLNEILNQMDGFTQNNVTVIAATNNIDALDKALLRPGRFDRLVEIGLPNMKSRYAIIDHYCSKIAYTGDTITFFAKIAKQTKGFSGADLKNLINESAVFAARANKDHVSEKDLEQALKKVLKQKQFK